MQKKIIYITLVSFISLVVVSCGSNSKEDGGHAGSRGTAGLSVEYIGTENRAKVGFIDHYKVHATDQNGDPISKLKVVASLVNGVKSINKHKLHVGRGSIESSTPIVFSDNNVDFSQTSVKRGDNLIILPTSGRKDSIYLGNWTISSVDTKLTLREKAVNLESTDNLSYIIGGEKRYFGNNYRGRIAIAHVNETNATTNADGFSYFDVLYDTSLAAHTVALGVHIEDNRRLSTGTIAGLRGGTYSSNVVKLPITGRIEYAHMRLSVGSGKTGMEPIIDLTAVPEKFSIEPADTCILDVEKSNFHTDAYGMVSLAIHTRVNVDKNATTEQSFCTVTWEGSVTAFYFEY